MSGLFTWISVTLGMLFAAFLWFAYLVRIVFNDEIVQEKRRRRMRARELERRRIEDAARKKRLDRGKV
ncbi:MAG: hypothetical protein LBJ46_07995 [Planctomycetota bacterium]|jgi:hypothetical protein|nr:hypothetical protein [Planctomycetota bacterium]